ncbi:hypothetical protein GCM10009528_32130 [Kineococcus aurantiacus]
MARMKGPWSWLLAVIWLGFAAMGAMILSEDHTPGGLIIGAAVLATGLFCGARAALSHVRLTDEGLVYVGYARTRRVPWTQVSEVVVAELGSALPITTVGVSVRLYDATEVELPALAGFAVAGHNRRVQRLVDAAERRRAGKG